MRLVQYSWADQTIRIGAQDESGFIIDLNRAYALLLASGRTKDPQTIADEAIPAEMEQLLAKGVSAVAAAQKALDFALSLRGTALWQGVAYEPSEARLHAPLLRPGKIICVGANYQDHADEAGIELPSEPVFFSKYLNAIVGPADNVRLPRVSSQVDWEAELVAVIGRRGRNISEADAMNYVAGYTVGNDISARDWQLHKPLRQWMIGKTFDTFLPLGPAIVTPDEVSDPYKLRITCSVNGETMQDSTTSLMHFRIAELVAYFSQVVTLQPGDIFMTGTPAGIGGARKPPRFLQPGDTLVTYIEELGTLTNLMASELVE